MTDENGLLGKLCAHLGKGRLDADDVLRMAEIDRDCPDSCRPTPGRLYRAVTVSEEDHDDLIAGRDVIIGARSHDCWSASDVRIRHVLRHRSHQDKNRPVCLILGRDFTAEDLAVDVEALARHLGMDRCGIGLGVT